MEISRAATTKPKKCRITPDQFRQLCLTRKKKWQDLYSTHDTQGQRAQPLRQRHTLISLQYHHISFAPVSRNKQFGRSSN